MLYLISNNQNQVKIGWSKHPEKRVRELQTGTADKLRLVRTFNVEKYYEKRLHYLLRDFKTRHNGEWFKISPESALSLLDEVLPF